MTVKIKFLNNAVSQNKFVHNLVNSKKRNEHYKHFYHSLIENPNNVAFTISDENKKIIVACEFDFYPAENLVEVEFRPCDFEKLKSLLVFELLESINEKAVTRFLDERFYFDGGMDFYYVPDSPNPNIRKISSDKDDYLEVTNSRIIGQILTEIKALDFI